jgi:hypothetical protein
MDARWWSIVGGALLLAGQAQSQLVPELEDQKLKGPDAPMGGVFGSSVAAQGDELFVGAPGANAPLEDSGAVHVFHWTGTTWLQTQLLSASDAGTFDLQGTDVDVDGDTLVVGSEWHDHILNNQGMAFAYRKQGGIWVEEQHLFPNDPDVIEGYGHLVALSGDRAFVLGYFDATKSLDGQAAIYVFQHTPGGWIDAGRIVLEGLTKLTTSLDSLAAWGNLVALGSSKGHPDFTFDPGNVRVYELMDGVWSLQATLAAEDGTPHDSFGFDLVFQGERLVVGSPKHDVTPNGDEGAIFVYRREGARWVPEPVDPVSLPSKSLLGNSVALDGSLLLAGAPGSEPGGLGAGFVFRWTGTAWSAVNRLVASDQVVGDSFGSGSALSGPMAIVSSPGDWTGSSLFNPHGSAYTFDTLPPGWRFRGGSVAGVQGHPSLTATGPLGGGGLVTMRLEQAAPLAPVVIVIGFSGLLAPFKGGVLVPHPDVLVTGLLTNAEGVLSISATWPALPSGTMVDFQEWIVDAAAFAGLAAGNGVQARVP